MTHHYLRLSQSVLLPELDFIKFEYRRYWSRFWVRKKSTFEVCPRCAQKAFGSHDKRVSIVRDAPIRNKNVELIIEKRRFRCLNCRCVFTEPIPGLVKGRRSTQRFRRALCEAAENFTSLSRVRKKFQCSSYLVYKVLYEQLELKARTRLYPWPKTIGIDENRFGKSPHYKYTRYSTVIRDHKNKRLFELVDGRTKAELVDALKLIPGRQNVRSVSMDLSSSFRSFVNNFFPNAKITADHFHVVRLLHPHINRMRKQYAGDKRKNPIGRLLLCNGAKLDFFKRSIIEKWLDDKVDLKTIYDYKEALHRLYRIKGYKRAKIAFFKLTDHMAHCQLKEIKSLRRTLMSWKWEILRYFKNRLTNAAVEGMNNKIKLLKKQAYGYKNFENYRLRCLNACA